MGRILAGLARLNPDYVPVLGVSRRAPSRQPGNPGASATVQAQLWYRDPLSTSNQTTSLSDAIELVAQP